MRFKYSTLIFCLLALFGIQILFAAQDSKAYTIIEDKATTPVLTSSMTDIRHLKIRLNNGIEVYLTSDPKADKSGAALAVEVGFWDDPANTVGMAHFLEHLLFLGTEKYPQEGGYHKFIKENGGMANASTSSKLTCYEFEINNDVFASGLDRFAQFFIQPSFNTSGIERERHAVDQEMAFRKDMDGLRRFLVTTELANPNHPFQQWGCGNLETLSSITRDDLITWYQAHYSANLMHLSVYSSLPMESLLELVVDEFSSVSDKNFKSNQYPGSLFDKKYLGQMVYVKPVQDIKVLTLQWDLPAEFANDKEFHTTDVIGYLLTNKDTSSLYTLLKREGLIDDMGAEGADIGSLHNIFELTFELTEKGVKEVDKMIQYCFEAINTFKAMEIPNYPAEEIRDMSRLNYQYQSRKQVFSKVQNDAIAMITENLASYPEKTRWAKKFDARKAHRLLKQLTPKKCLFVLNADPQLTGVEPQHYERWTGAAYALEAIPTHQLDAWGQIAANRAIKVPPKNAFIPDHLRVVNHMDQTFTEPNPELIMHTHYAKAYYAPDNNFGVPKVNWNIYLNTPFCRATPKNYVLQALYMKSVIEELAPQSYMAAFAGMNYALSLDTELGLNINIVGYSQKAPLLLKEVLGALHTTYPTLEEFNRYKEVIKSDYLQQTQQMPVRQALDTVANVLYQDHISWGDKILAIEDLQYDDLLEFIDVAYNEVYIRAMLYGNLTIYDSKYIFDEINASFFNAKPYPLTLQPKQAVIDLSYEKEEQYVIKDIQMTGNVTLLLVGEGAFSFQKRAAQQILQQSIDAPFFDTLRTQQQTGYLVHSYGRDNERQLFSTFLVQSETHSPRDLLNRFDTFNTNFLEEINQGQFTQENFEALKQAELVDLKQTPKNLSEMAARLNQDAFRREGDFRWFEKRITGLEQLNFEEFLHFVNRYLNEANAMRIAFLIQGKNHQDDFSYQDTGTNITEFKRNNAYVTRDHVLIDSYQNTAKNQNGDESTLSSGVDNDKSDAI